MGTGNGRARRSAVLLIGFPIVAGVQLGVVVLPVLLVLAILPGPVAARIGPPLCLATVGVMAYATWRALHQRRVEPVGVPVARHDAPELWRIIDAAAQAAGTGAPDAVTVVAEAAATLSERSRLLGLLGGRRVLYLGLPLLQAWYVPQMRALITHELAHGSPRASRWAPLAYRGRVAVARVVPRISRRNPAGPALIAYGRLYRRLDEPFSHAHELAADRLAADAAGAAAMTDVLRDLPVLDAARRLFYAEYLGPGWQVGYVPDDIFGGFLRVLAARAGELIALRARGQAAPAPWDTHPPIAQRLAALAAHPTPATDAGAAAAAPAADGAGSAAQPAGHEQEPAADLVPDLPGLGRALQAVAFTPQGRTTVDWDGFFSAARTAELQREADAALSTVSRAIGQPVRHAGEVLDLAADGRLQKAAATVFPDLPDDRTVERVAELVKLLVALAALRSGAARWRHSWTGAAELVAPDGAPLDLGALAALAVDPARVEEVRQRLRTLDIDVSAAEQDGTNRSAVRAEVVSGLVNLAVDGARADLLIVGTGLVVVPGLPRSHSGAAKVRLARLAAVDQPEREAAVPGARFVPYEDVVAAEQTRRTPRSWRLRLRDGAALNVRTGLDSDELPGGWAAFDAAVAFLAGRRLPLPGEAPGEAPTSGQSQIG